MNQEHSIVPESKEALGAQGLSKGASVKELLMAKAGKFKNKINTMILDDNSKYKIIILSLY